MFAVLPHRPFSRRPILRSLRLATLGLLFLCVGIAPGRAWDGWIEIPTQKKLERAVLPSIEFRQAKLSDVLEFLRQEAARLSPDPDRAKRYINIVFNPPATPAAEPRVTLSMRQIPMSEVLKYVAAQAGLKVKIERYAVSLVPTTEPEPLVTATFRVSPTLFGNRTGVGTGKSALDQSAVSAQ